MSGRMKSLVVVELIEVWRSPTMFMMPLVVLVLTAIWGAVARDGSDGYLLAAVLLMTAYLVGFQIPALSLAEAKEKRTLEAVLLTPASPLEVIGAKALVGVGISLVTAGFALLILRQYPIRPGLMLLGFALALLLAVSLGILIGLVARDQKTAGEISAPVLIVLLLGSTMPWPRISPGLWEAMRWLPTRPLLELLQGAGGGHLTAPWQPTLVMLFYAALSVFAAARIIRRQASR